MAVGPGIGPVVNVAAAHQALVLAMGHDEFAQGLGPAHGLLHVLGVLDPPAVVGESHHIGGQPLQIGQVLPLLPYGDGAVGIDMDHAVPLNEVQLGLEVFQAVRHRFQVGHGADRGKPSVGCRPGPGGDGLFA